MRSPRIRILFLALIASLPCLGLASSLAHQLSPESPIYSFSQSVIRILFIAASGGLGTLSLYAGLFSTDADLDDIQPIWSFYPD